MKKNGFIFVESIVVLMIVALSVTMLMSSYSLISRKTKEKENYDKASDKYLLYAIANLGTDSKCNYGIDCDEDNGIVEFEASKSTCERTKMGRILYNCSQLFDDMGIKYIYVIKNVRNTLNDYKRNNDGYALDNSGKIIDRDKNNNSPVKISDRSELAVSKYDNGAIEYMKTLKKCNDENIIDEDGNYINRNKETDVCYDSIMYMIGVFERGNEFYYAAIDISGNVKYEENIRQVKNGWVCENCNNDPKPAISNQQWYYYQNNIKLKGLYKLPTASNAGAWNFYFYFDNNGLLQTGWVFYEGSYHLYSTIDNINNKGNGNLDGWRIQSMSDTRLKVTINDTKDYYVDKQGVCYTCLSGDCKCTSSDLTSTISKISMDNSKNYYCNGDECYE